MTAPIIRLMDDTLPELLLQAIGRELGVKVEYPTELAQPRRVAFLRQMFDIVHPHPNPADVVDLTSTLESPELEQALANVEAARRVYDLLYAPLDDPRTAEQKECDELADDWRDTYNSLLP